MLRTLVLPPEPELLRRTLVLPPLLLQLSLQALLKPLLLRTLLMTPLPLLLFLQAPLKSTLLLHLQLLSLPLLLMPPLTQLPLLVLVFCGAVDSAASLVPLLSNGALVLRQDQCPAEAVSAVLANCVRVVPMRELSM